MPGATALRVTAPVPLSETTATTPGSLEVQRAVGSPRQLRDWGLVEEGAFQTVVASNFRRTWETQQKRDAAKAALPAELRELVTGLADKLALDSHAT